MMPTISALQQALSTGETTAEELTRQALARARDAGGQGRFVFTRLYPERAIALARASDLMRAAGVVRSPLEGLPISIKDLFDVAGETTLAGSVVLRGAPPARTTAHVVQRLVNAGAVITGKTNMTEFAYSGVGINPHTGTPSGPWDREHGRIPGGSSSGAGVAVADGMSVVSIGTDTGGSVRIPSAFCGLTGFKPTARRVPRHGALPLSTSLDSIGPLAASVACCAAVDAVLAGASTPREVDSMRSYAANDASTIDQHVPHPHATSRLRFAVPATIALEGADDIVRATFERALQRLRAAGACVDSIEIPEFRQLAVINAKGGLTAAEAWVWHKELIQTRANEYDPRVAPRILRGRDLTAADYIELLATRQQWIAAVERRLEGFDALLMPTVPIIAPPIQTLVESDDSYFQSNALILRNATFINFLDGCALSLPCHEPGQAPVGLTVAGVALQDAHILRVGASVEKVIHEDQPE
ncbi:MAG: amidase [Candidimonas sp.]|nr:MAG: amidase [Candidimonas sp.]